MNATTAITLFFLWSAVLTWAAFRAMIDMMASDRATDSEARARLEKRGRLRALIAAAVFALGVVVMLLLRV